MTASREPDQDVARQIWLQGARTRNLQGIDVEFPALSFVVVTGVSGAGKTSLAVSTLAAEGRRRFVETFPTSARRFLERLERPDCDQIGPLPPAIIHQHSLRQASRRSTVATLSEISGTLQHLFAAVGQIYCPQCQIPVFAYSAPTVSDVLLGLPAGIRFQLGFRFPLDAATIPDVFAAELLESGFQRVVVQGQTREMRVPLPRDWPAAAEWFVIADRLQTGRLSLERLIDSLELTLQRGQGSCLVILHERDSVAGVPFQLEGESVKLIEFHTRPICTSCQREFPLLNPRQFTINSPVGACTQCRGLGLQGDVSCGACGGNRLSPDSLAVRCGRRSYGDVISMTIQDVITLTLQWGDEFPEPTDRLARPWLIQLRRRLELLDQLGLGYLSLNRSGRTLSTGESQRLSLAATCAVELVNSLYVLEEPASGLHPRDLIPLIRVLSDLKGRRNTIVITEHVSNIIRAADIVVDLGPGAGPDGGQVVFQGTPQDLLQVSSSTTAEYFSGRKRAQTRQRRSPSSWLTLGGVRFRNLNGVDVKFPLGTLCVVTGFSGSGKTSLIRDTLLPAVSSRLKQTAEFPFQGTFHELDGELALQSVVYVDQTIPERSSRGNVATASGIWPEIRTILANVPESKIRQFTAGTFSFHNANGGRCPNCEGRGTVAIDLQFLADLNITCPECGGSRFQREVLEVKYRGHHVAEILGLTVTAGLSFFRGKSRLQRRLKSLKDVGLGFLQLGQPIASLSGGETQRLKLADRMMAKPSGATLFLLDEPARGLHPADIQGLVYWFDDLLNEGHSFIVIEHREELVYAADYVIELGPGAGPAGGRIINSAVNRQDVL